MTLIRRSSDIPFYSGPKAVQIVQSFPFNEVKELVQAKIPSERAVKIVLEYANIFANIYLPKEGNPNISAYFIDNPKIVQIIPPEVWREVIRKYGNAK